MYQMFPLYKFYHIATTNAGVQIVTGSGVLGNINVNTPIANQFIKIYDGTSTTGSLIASISIVTTTSPPPTLWYEVQYATGLFLVTTTGAADVTIAYK